MALTGCSKKPSEVTIQDPQAKLATKGKQIYQTYCIACHNSNPKIAGAIGPDLFGSSLELIRLRVLEGNYPTGYRPKRPTHLMTKFPQLSSEIDALHAYLNDTSSK